MDALHLAAELVEQLLVAAGVHDRILLALNHQNAGLGRPSPREGSTCFQQDQVVIEPFSSFSRDGFQQRRRRASAQREWLSGPLKETLQHGPLALRAKG